MIVSREVEPLDISSTNCKYLLMTDNNSLEKVLLKEAHVNTKHHNVVFHYGFISQCCQTVAYSVEYE